MRSDEPFYALEGLAGLMRFLGLLIAGTSPRPILSEGQDFDWRFPVGGFAAGGKEKQAHGLRRTTARAI